MNIIEKICAQSELTPEQQKTLADWERADTALGWQPWTPQDRAENALFIQQHPEIPIVAPDLAKFGSVDSLISRYNGLLRRCVDEGLLSPIQEEESAKMARYGGISIAGVIREGKALKEWLDEETERREITQEFTAARAGKTVLTA